MIDLSVCLHVDSPQAWSALMRTLWSVLDRSPEQYLKEVATNRRVPRSYTRRQLLIALVDTTPTHRSFCWMMPAMQCGCSRAWKKK